MRLRQWFFAIAIFVMTVCALGGRDAHATHFRYGHYSWKPGTGTTIQFTLQNAFRRDGFRCVNPATLATVACSAADGFPGVGDVFPETIGSSRFNPGDGSPVISSPLGVLLYKVTSIDPGNNNLFALALDPAALPAVSTTITHTYPAPGNYLAFTDSCCRIVAFDAPNALINNADGGYRVETVVNVGTGNSSPVSVLPPIVVCPINAPCSFFVPVSDPNGDRVRFRLSTSAEASTNTPFVQPGPPRAPNAAAIDSATGLYTWNTTGAALGPSGFNTLYSTQVIIEDLDASGNPKSKVALDFMIQLVTLTPPLPVFDTPPTLACGTTFTTTAGGRVSFPIQTSVASATKTITQNAVGLPLGATMTPALPVVGNPVSSTFSWTPTASQTGSTVVTFEARDSTGQQVLCSVTIQVLERIAKGKMTGLGKVPIDPTHSEKHAFLLHCDGKRRNELEVVWGSEHLHRDRDREYDDDDYDDDDDDDRRHKDAMGDTRAAGHGRAGMHRGLNWFHMERLTSALCYNDQQIKSDPKLPFNAYRGTGVGRLNGWPGATAEWTFTDAGHGGRKDTVKIIIRNQANKVVLSVTGTLVKGDHRVRP